MHELIFKRHDHQFEQFLHRMIVQLHNGSMGKFSEKLLDLNTRINILRGHYFVHKLLCKHRTYNIIQNCKRAWCVSSQRRRSSRDSLLTFCMFLFRNFLCSKSLIQYINHFRTKITYNEWHRTKVCHDSLLFFFFQMFWGAKSRERNSRSKSQDSIDNNLRRN